MFKSGLVIATIAFAALIAVAVAPARAAPANDPSVMFEFDVNTMDININKPTD